LKRKQYLGFTIIEMLVVIAIIAILLSVIYPALTSSRKRAKKTNELNLIRETGKAWIMHSGMHQDRLLEGYLSKEVQAYDQLAWAFQDESIVPPAPEYNPTDPNEAGPWPWRLLSYMDYKWRTLLFYDDLEWDNKDENVTEHAEQVATQPAFGYNGFYLGGWWEIDNHSGKPWAMFSDATLSDDRQLNVVASSFSQIKKTNKQIVFCSTFLAQEGDHDVLQEGTAGTHLAIPSIFARVTKWEPLPSKRIRVNTNTFAPLGRFNGVPAICFADGSTKNVEIETLTDQTLWIPQAQQVGDVPASEFSHTQ
jgi:prepilin-type N-terminal cleavage/methylation domain-containing protein